jgi:hypothetical protein
MPKRRLTGQPKRVIRAIAFENDRGTLLPSRFVCSADCTPVNGHRNRGRRHEEQARGRESTGLRPCFFLLIQVKYRGFTGTASHFRFASRPHSEERASRTMGGWHLSRPRPVLPPSPFGLRRTSRDGASRLLRTRIAFMQTPGALVAGRNSNCGFSPTPFWRDRQKNGCQES